MDIASWFIDEFNSLETERSLKDRLNLLSGNTVTAIVAGRFVKLFHLDHPFLFKSDEQ